MRLLLRAVLTVAIAGAVVLPIASGADAVGGPSIVVLGGPEAISEEVVAYLETCTTADVVRVGGSDRYETAGAISRWAEYATGGTVLLASGTDFPDALAAASWAAAEAAPVLLTAPEGLPDGTRDALAALQPARTVIVGGAMAVSESVEVDLETGDYGEIARIAGSDRFDTAAEIVAASGVRGGTVYVATGSEFPDALAGARAAALSESAVLLVDKLRIPTATEVALLDLKPSEIVVLGGEEAVSGSVEAALKAFAPTVRRIAGSNRYGTAAKISRVTHPDNALRVYIASGEGFPDALSVSALSTSHTDGPILLSARHRLPPETAAEISRFSGLPCSGFDARTDEPPLGPRRVTVAFVGDTGTGGVQQREVASLISAQDADENLDYLVILGDMIYEYGDPSLIDEVILEPYAETLQEDTGLLPVLGNHDVILGAGDEIMSTLGAQGRWYAVSTSLLQLVVLDSTRPHDPDQLRFLRESLSNSRSTWTIVNLHHPPFSAGAHGSDEDMRKVFVPIFEKHNVDLVMSGHDHDYQRSHPIDGITYIVSGGGGKLRPTGTEPFTAVSASVPHFVVAVVEEGTVNVTAISTRGILDEFQLTR